MRQPITSQGTPDPERDPCLAGLPPDVASALGDLRAAARAALGEQLVSMVLYGSGAEGRLRATSDVNIILILSAFDAERLAQLRDPLRVAEAAIRLRPMVLLEGEIRTAAEAFAEKFSDILRRRRVLYGQDPFAGVAIPREVVLARLGQVLLNAVLRMREQYLLRSPREEQLARALADAAGPLRSCAATLLGIEGHPAETPKAALQRLAASFGATRWEQALSALSEARDRQLLPPGAAQQAFLDLIRLAEAMREHVQRLRQARP